MKVPESNATNRSNSANVSALPIHGAASAAGGSSGKPDGGLERNDQVQVSALSQRLNATYASRISELSGMVSAGRFIIVATVFAACMLDCGRTGRVIPIR